MITAIIAVLTLVALRPTYVPPLSQEPTSFDGQRAHEDLRTLTADFPRRIAGSDTDNQAMLWIGNRLEEIGLRPHFEPFVDGRKLLKDPTGLGSDLLHPASSGMEEIAVNLSREMGKKIRKA